MKNSSFENLYFYGIIILLAILLFSLLLNPVSVSESNEKNTTNSTENIPEEQNTPKSLNLSENKVIYCYKQQNQKKVYEVYLSNNSFYEKYNYTGVDERIFTNQTLYTSSLTQSCSWIKEDYHNIYENFYATFLNNYNSYTCENLTYSSNFFKVENEDSICSQEIQGQIVFEEEIINE